MIPYISNLELFTRWFLGYMVQIAPVAFICIYPFRDHYRYSNKSFWTAISLTILLSDVIFTSVLGYLDLNQIGDIINVAHIMFLFSLVLLLLAYIFLIQSEFIYKLFIFFIGMSYGFGLEVTYRTINSFLQIDSVRGQLYPWFDILIQIVMNIILFIPMLHLMNKISESFSEEINPRYWRILTTILAGIVSLLIIFYDLPYSTSLGFDKVLSLFITILCFFIFLLYHWIFEITDV